MRLNRFLAAAGFGSRRSCDALIASGAVAINGHYIDKLATVVQPDDDVRVNGRQARAALPVYLLFNKPKGVIVSKADERGRRTVFDMLPPNFANLFHVGRLDKESEGLLILTNDGDLAQRLTHPTHEVEKEYEVTLDKPFDQADAARMLKGIYIEGGRAKFERIRSIAPTRLKVVLRQGIKRQIRLMFYDRGYEVERLVRIRIGQIRDPEMPAGTYRLLQPAEVAALRTGGKEKTRTKTPPLGQK
ncbi:MAG: pseudouridine synthase [Terrimicrobiaceae bacterium]|jgi:23S rRNA pseudouridine2605 synthase